jgi:hypothetical protein
MDKNCKTCKWSKTGVAYDCLNDHACMGFNLWEAKERNAFKSCKTCKWVDRQFCKHPTGTCTHELNDNKFFQKWEGKTDNRCVYLYYIPKAKDMDKIQMTEEQFNQLMHDCIITDFKTGYVNLLETRIKAKQAGFIKKDIVEDNTKIIEYLKNIISILESKQNCLSSDVEALEDKNFRLNGNYTVALSLLHEQKQLNAEMLEVLRDLMAMHYSYSSKFITDKYRRKIKSIIEKAEETEG